MFVPKFYKKQHELLGLIVSKARDSNKTGSFPVEQIYISKDELIKLLKITPVEFEEIAYALMSDKAIQYQFDNGQLHFYIGNNSASSYYYKKQLVDGRKYVVEKFFDYFKIISGVVLLIIAIITFIVNSLSTYNTQKKVEELGKQVQANMDSIRAIKGHR